MTDEQLLESFLTMVASHRATEAQMADKLRRKLNTTPSKKAAKKSLITAEINNKRNKRLIGKLNK